MAGTAISLKDLKQFIGDYLKISGASHGLGVETKKSFLEIMADDFRLASAAEKKGLEKRPEIQAAIWDAQRQAAFAAFSKSHLAAYKVADAELKAHYDQYTDRFQGPGTLKLNLIVVDDPQAAERAMAEAKKGTPWKTLFEKYANKASTGNWDAGWVEVSKLKAVLPEEGIQALLKSKLDSPIGPVSGPEGLMLFNVLERRPGPAMPLDTCREAVRLDYLKGHGAELVDKYLDSEGRKGIRVLEYPENARP